MENKLFFNIFFLMIGLATIGCSNICTIHVITIPPGANVTFDGKTQSDSPCTVTFEENEDIDVAHYLYITKAGYHNVRKIFKQSDYPSRVTITLEKTQ